MKFLKKNYMWAGIYAFLLIAFTLYVVLDTFVITRIYTKIPDNNSVIDNTQTEPTQTGAGQTDYEETKKPTVVSEKSYSDSNISITITEYREYDTDIYVADIKVSSIEYLKTAFAQDAYGRNITAYTSKTAEENSAILAINGDYYGSQTKGYVLRDGVLYRETSNNKEDIVIWKDGSFEIIEEKEISASELLDRGALQVLSFGPALLIDSNISVSKNDEVDIAMTSNPRTAIGIIDDLHYVFVVSDGRTSESEGLTLYQLASFMKSINVDVAYNLDGGGSATMYFNGKIINNPTTNGRTIKERKVSDIVYIGY